MLTLSRVYHRVEVLTDSPKDTSVAAGGGANVEEAASVCKENIFCQPVSSGNKPPPTLQYLSTEQEEASP